MFQSIFFYYGKLFNVNLRSSTSVIKQVLLNLTRSVSIWRLINFEILAGIYHIVFVYSVRYLKRRLCIYLNLEV